MEIKYTSKFKKQYKKLPQNFQNQFDLRLKLFVTDYSHPLLKVHPLKGKFTGYWSMNVNADLRAIYLLRENEVVIFALIGTHSELYG